MRQLIWFVVATGLCVTGWAWAREQAMLKHSDDVKIEQMQEESCPPSTTSGNG
jgi:hypothetical protein